MWKLRSNVQSLLVLVFLMTLVSCGARKKTYRNVSAKSENDRVYRGNATPTDASDSRNIVWGYSLLKNYAALLNVDEYVIQKNQALYRFIDSWKGSPHRLGGDSRNGVDCSGFVNILYQNIYRKSLPRTSRDMAEIVKRKYDHQLKEGDLVFFSFGGRQIDHVGLYLHNNKFVHVSTRKGVIISDLKDPWYYKHIKRCGTPRV